jgi:adenosylhomocysteinase
MTYPSITEQLEDPGAARESGRTKMAWAREHMPILAALREGFEADRPFEGEVVGMAMHVEAKTAVLAELLAQGGAEVAIPTTSPSNG